ncbi:unnamed protein product [Hymenolepis diminuta]|uniref:Torsin-1A-interacting protein 1/2 AAA+ activator domain-containing protein n=1 Tax=Hymenolepis diminuta TaxID=6216 RepID=A0A564Y8T0_HYMDI|nr:unnamed protein product [Hymenolepis diminuta]
MESMFSNRNTRKRIISVRDKRGQFTEPDSPSSVKIEPNSDNKERNEPTNANLEKTSVEINNHNSSVETSGHCLSIFVPIVVILVVSLLCWLPSAEYSSPDNSIYRQMAELKRSFPGQNSRLWMVLKSAIITQTRFSSSLNAGAVVDGAPKVLLISPSSDPAKNESYQRFLRHFENSLSNMRHHWKCMVIDPFKFLFNISPDDVKWNMHDQMEKAYRNGFKCLHVIGIDRLPGDAALALHGNTDPLNSPFKDAFLLFSIQKPPEISNRTSQREMETVLRKYLRSLWEKDLGGDVTYALINRLTGRIGIFEI